MTEAGSETGSRAWTMGGGLTVLALISVPLWSEFHVPGNIAWNAFLAVFLIGVAAAALVAHHYFRAHAGEIGEARFDTSDEAGRNG